MGTSVLWRTYDADKPVTFSEVPGRMDVAGKYALHRYMEVEFSGMILTRLTMLSISRPYAESSLRIIL